MNINKKIEGEIVSNTLQIAPFNKYYQWTVDHAPGSPSKYMTTIYNDFCIKMIFLDFWKVKKNYENMLQNAPNCIIKTFFSGKHARNPPRVASPPPQKK